MQEGVLRFVAVETAFLSVVTMTSVSLVCVHVMANRAATMELSLAVFECWPLVQE